MKNKYQRMTKEEKKEIIGKYRKTEKGKYLMAKLKNVMICGIISYVYAIYLIIDAKNIWSYIGALGVFIFGCVFIVSSIRLRNKNLNKFAINENEKSSK